MTVKTGSAWAGLFVTLDSTGALAAGSPSGVLYVDGVADAATVTITGTNPYKWSVTLPALTAGQRVDMYITATISSIATAGIVASDQADTILLSDGVPVLSIATDAITEIQSGLATQITANAIKAKTDLLDMSKVNVVTPVNGSTITILRGDTFIATLTDIGNLTNYISLDFSVKRTVHEPDDNATIRIRKNVSGTDDGLLRLNGAAHAVGTDGSIAIDDAATGDITIMLNAGVTKELVSGNYVYDIQLIEADEVSTLTGGTLIVSPDVTRLVA